MALTVTPARTVTPQPQENDPCGCGTALTWVAKSTFATDDYWLDLSLVVPSGVTVSQFSYAIVEGDSSLAVMTTQQTGNAFGLLFFAGTPLMYYVVRIAAILPGGVLLTYDVALPIAATSTPWPSSSDVVTLNDAGLNFDGELLPSGTDGNVDVTALTELPDTVPLSDAYSVAVTVDAITGNPTGTYKLALSDFDGVLTPEELEAVWPNVPTSGGEW